MDETQREEVVGARKAKKWRQEDLAKAAHLHVKTIRNMEAGKRVTPSTAAMVYRALGMPAPVPIYEKRVQNVMGMVGFALSSREGEERERLIDAITSLLVDW